MSWGRQCQRRAHKCSVGRRVQAPAVICSQTYLLDLVSPHRTCATTLDSPALDRCNRTRLRATARSSRPWATSTPHAMALNVLVPLVTQYMVRKWLCARAARVLTLDVVDTSSLAGELTAALSRRRSTSSARLPASAMPAVRAQVFSRPSSADASHQVLANLPARFGKSSPCISLLVLVRLTHLRLTDHVRTAARRSRAPEACFAAAHSVSHPDDGAEALRPSTRLARSPGCWATLGNRAGRVRRRGKRAVKGEVRSEVSTCSDRFGRWVHAR